MPAKCPALGTSVATEKGAVELTMHNGGGCSISGTEPEGYAAVMLVPQLHD
jgi:hypothetical protein